MSGKKRARVGIVWIVLEWGGQQTYDFLFVMLKKSIDAKTI